MTDYIDREKLLRDIEKYHLSDGKFQHWVEIQPAADVAPVIHAHWEMRPSGENGSGEIKAYCSHCGKPNKQYQPPYCPHCGAKMDEEENNG